MKRKTLTKWAVGLLVIVPLVLTACGAKAIESQSNLINQTDSTIEKNSLSPSDVNTSSTEEVSSEPEVPQIEVTAEFNEEFEIKEGEKLYIGTENISIEITNIDYYDFSGLTDAKYTMTIDGTPYDGYASWNATDSLGSLLQRKYSANRIIVTNANTDQSITLKITEPIETPAPLVLSGNPEDVYVTTKQEYVVSDDIILFLCEGTTLYGDTMELIHTIKDLVEKETGLKLNAQAEFAEVGVRGEIDVLYGQGSFPGVDHNKEKFHVHIVPFETASPYASKGAITLNPMDLEIAAGEGYAFVHEMTHCAQMANGRLISTTMNEGFATYITGQITERDEIIPFNFNAEYNYSHYDREITAETAENIFIEETDNSDDKYCLGYRFVSFLFDQYGDDIYRNILFDASSTFGLSGDITEEAMIPVIKRNTSEEVFEEFADWLKKNRKRFDGK
ncbi:MAG: hypothetical protein IJW63_08880 [Lachnospiraceae bacterium]|nr:hypothetical protein [Lachnospiraceae bacterium]